MRETNQTVYQSTIAFKNSKNTALYFRKKMINYIEFHKRVDHFADVFFSCGVKKNDVVSVLSPNIPECIIAYYALDKIGAISAFLHPLFPVSQLPDTLKENGSKFFIVLDIFYKKYKKSISDLALQTFVISPEEDLFPLERLFYRIKNRDALKEIEEEKYLYRIKPERSLKEINTDYLKPSVYLRSGGTTGKSKTVILNDQQLLYPGSLAREIVGRELSGKAIIGVLPLFHGFGLAMGVIAPLMNDAGSCLMIKFDLDEVIKRLKKDQLNILIAVPYLIKKILDSNRFKGDYLKNLYATYVGADKTPLYIIDEYNKLMDDYSSKGYLLEGYGLTETVTVTFVNTHSENRVGSVGKPLKGTEFKIVSKEDMEHDLGDNVQGMIIIASPALCLGYLNDSLPVYIDKNNKKWLITGDIGYHDKDGFLYFSNRKNDVYKIAGYNVFPSMIEELATSVEEVKFACCLFVEDDNHPYLKLFVELQNDVDEKAIEKRLNTLFTSKLLKYSCPEKIVFLSAFPRTDVGKIDKKKLKEMN